MLTAQDLYNEREAHGLISGTDLHELFRAVCGDEPSPAGRTEIDPARLAAYAEECRQGYAAHKASGGVGGEYLLDIARFAESFAR